MEISKEYVFVPLSYQLRSCSPKANILIDNDKHAVLADFSLITLIPDQTTFESTCLGGGTVRWMSPELMEPTGFGLEKSRPTKESDCYALGMVIYEVLGGCMPYGGNDPFAVYRKVLDRKRPERPEGEAGKWFTDDIWKLVELCWKHEPGERAGARAVLLALGGKPDQPDVSEDVVTDEESDVDDQPGGATNEPCTLSQSHSKLTSDHSRSMTGPRILNSNGAP